MNELPKELETGLSPSPSSVYLLSLLYADNRSEVWGKTRLVKMVLLLQDNLANKYPEIKEEFGVYKFAPMWYGPASIDLFDDIAALLTLNAINERERVTDFGILHIYSITDEGVAYLRKLAGKYLDVLVTEADKVKKMWNKKKLIELLQYVYRKYPELTKKSIIADFILI